MIASLRTLLAHPALRVALLIAVLVFAFDWATKTWALDRVQHEAMPVGGLKLGVERNDGFAFSYGAGRVPAEAVLIVRLLALTTLVLLWRRVGFQSRRLACGFAILLAGGLGNVADLMFRGGVIDFIHAGPFTFEVAGETIQAGFVFNAADVAILFALGLLAPAIREWSRMSHHRLITWRRARSAED